MLHVATSEKCEHDAVNRDAVPEYMSSNLPSVIIWLCHQEGRPLEVYLVAAEMMLCGNQDFDPFHCCDVVVLYKAHCFGR